MSPRPAAPGATMPTMGVANANAQPGSASQFNQLNNQFSELEEGKHGEKQEKEVFDKRWCNEKFSTLKLHQALAFFFWVLVVFVEVMNVYTCYKFSGSSKKSATTPNPNDWSQDYNYHYNLKSWEIYSHRVSMVANCLLLVYLSVIFLIGELHFFKPFISGRYLLLPIYLLVSLRSWAPIDPAHPTVFPVMPWNMNEAPVKDPNNPNKNQKLSNKSGQALCWTTSFLGLVVVCSQVVLACTLRYETLSTHHNRLQREKAAKQLEKQETERLKNCGDLAAAEAAQDDAENKSAKKLKKRNKKGNKDNLNDDENNGIAEESTSLLGINCIGDDGENGLSPHNNNNNNNEDNYGSLSKTKSNLSTHSSPDKKKRISIPEKAPSDCFNDYSGGNDIGGSNDLINRSNSDFDGKEGKKKGKKKERTLEKTFSAVSSNPFSVYEEAGEGEEGGVSGKNPFGA